MQKFRGESKTSRSVLTQKNNGNRKNNSILKKKEKGK